MTERNDGSLRNIYEFMGKVSPANWQTRWNGTPYMESFASQEDLEKIGKIETVSGHVWGCMLLGMQIKNTCSSLGRIVNFENVYERIAVHDVGETEKGDVSLASKVDDNFDMGKDGEREEYIKLVSDLPKKMSKRLILWFDEFEDEPDENTPLEALVARWIDHLHGDCFALTFGENHSEFSETIEKIMKIRSVLRSRQLIDALVSRDREETGATYKAAMEVDNVAREHIEMVREAGVRVDFSDLGF